MFNFVYVELIVPQKHTTSWDEVGERGEPCSARIELVWNKKGRIDLAFGTHTENMSLHEDSVQTGWKKVDKSSSRQAYACMSSPESFIMHLTNISRDPTVCKTLSYRISWMWKTSYYSLPTLSSPFFHPQSVTAQNREAEHWYHGQLRACNSESSRPGRHAHVLPWEQPHFLVSP